MKGDTEMRLFYIVFSFGLVASSSLWAVSVPHEFQSNTPALAAEVNDNFGALVLAINDLQAVTAQLQADLDTSETTIGQLDSELASAQTTIGVLESGLTTAETDIALLESGLTTAE